MQQNIGDFLCKSFARKIHHCFFSFTLVLLFSVAPAWSAGYTCPTAKQYTACSAGYYLNGTGPGNSCEKCPTGYPNSPANNTGGITSCYSDTKTRAWSGSQVNGSVPTNCASVTAWNSCSGSSCTYVAYSNSAGTGDGTIKSGCSSNSASCTKTPKTVTANANSYVDGTSCKTCSSYSSTYTKSDGGSIDSSSCYTNITRGCTQNNGSTPTGCASVTAWNACSCAGGTYKKYASGSTSGTTTNETCTKTAKTVTASSNYYVSGATCPSCSSYSSTYTKSDGGSIDSGSCYITRTNTGTEVAPSLPTGCSVQTTNACTKPTCSYKDYAGQTGETCSPGTCTQTHKACTSANANYYLASGVAKTCSSYSSSYPSSAGGNITSSSCYGTFSKSGSQIGCSAPTNCASATCNACTPGTCDYTKYASGTIKTDCTPSNCQQTVKSVTAKANYYVSGTSCSACSSLGDKTYTTSAANNSGGSGVCYKSCTKACTQQSVPTGAYSVTHGTTSTSGTHYYGGSCSAASSTCSLTVNSCSSKYYKSGNACSLCSGLSSAYANSANGNSSGTNACYTSCGGGTWVASANAACTDVTSGYWREAHTVNYGSTDTRNTCPETASGSDNGRDAKADCYVSCGAKTISNGTTTVVNSKEYYSGTAYPACTYNVNCNAKYGASGNKTSSPACTACGVGTYSAGGTSACAACTNKPANSSYAGAAASNTCAWACNSGYNQTDDNQCGQFCAAGVTHLKLGSGLSVPLYSSARTSPAINVKYNNSVCYGSLATGQSSGALNVKMSSGTYHAID